MRALLVLALPYAYIHKHTCVGCAATNYVVVAGTNLNTATLVYSYTTGTTKPAGSKLTISCNNNYWTNTGAGTNYTNTCTAGTFGTFDSCAGTCARTLPHIGVQRA